MMLLIDAGNTRVKWAISGVMTEALHVGSNGNAPTAGWLHLGMVVHADIDRLQEQWQGLRPDTILISNVAGAAIGHKLAAACDSIVDAPVPEWFASTAECAGVRNAYRRPAQLGSDRFASAIAARRLFPGQPAIIATCGTATTVDALTSEGLFAGGMILPGLGLMASSLAGNTAHLPDVAAKMAPSALFADNTEAAIVSGCLTAQAGAIDRAVHALAERALKDNRNGQAGALACILSGGAAAMVSPYLLSSHRLIDNLVLIGLETVALRRSEQANAATARPEGLASD